MSTATKLAAEEVGDLVTVLDFEAGGAVAYIDGLTRREGRIYYRDERVTIVSPSFMHEQGVVQLGAVVDEIIVELEIDCRSVASTMYRRDGVRRGAMPDCSYYFENRNAIRLTAKGHIDLDAGPPPDLIAEVVWTHGPDAVMEIYRALGIPEVWLFDVPTANLQFLHLDRTGNYVPRPHGRALPFVTPGEVLDQLRGIAPNEPDYRWRRRLRTWAREVLGPRRNDG